MKKGSDSILRKRGKSSQIIRTIQKNIFLFTIMLLFFVMSISCSDRGKKKQVDIKRGEEMEKPKLTDRGEGITPEEWNEAIECLIQKYPEEIFVEVWEAMKNEGDSWSGKRHLSLGMDVRNTLRSSGFQWGSIALDHYWDDLVEDATKKVISEKRKK